ncbi:MAG: hypothetical protein IJ222_08655 [Bacteroidales bacterium]|nr:hypothetical protein [Bacteroidales bacterium]
MSQIEKQLRKGEYSSPECGLLGASLCKPVLTGSDYGDPGHAGADPDIMDIIDL